MKLIYGTIVARRKGKLGKEDKVSPRKNLNFIFDIICLLVLLFCILFVFFLFDILTILLLCLLACHAHACWGICYSNFKSLVHNFSLSG